MKITGLYFFILGNVLVLGAMYLMYKIGLLIDAETMGTAISNLGGF